MRLEMKPGDEVIMPSTLLSAQGREGAKIFFTDTRSDHLGIDEDKITELIS